MKEPSARIAFLILGAVLTVALMAGARSDEEPTAAAPVALPKERKPEPIALASQLPDIELDKLKRPARPEDVPDLFAGKSWHVEPPPPPPPPPSKPAPPPKPAQPVAPPLPFAFLGKLDTEGEKTVFYLVRGAELLTVSVGDVIDNVYRIEAVEGEVLPIVYLPLSTRQTLSIAQPS